MPKGIYPRKKKSVPPTGTLTVQYRDGGVTTYKQRSWAEAVAMQASKDTKYVCFVPNPIVLKS